MNNDILSTEGNLIERRWFLEKAVALLSDVFNLK